jgi:uncharacterized membrane protein YdjX (TVP38/TMEM64 family)
LRIVSATLLLLAVILLPFFLFGSALEAKAAAVAAGGRGGIALAGATLLALDIVLPVPSSLVATAIGASLGFWIGTLVNAAGLSAGCALGLAIGRSGSPLARRILGTGLFAGFAERAARYGIVAVLLCRPVPVLAEASIIAMGAGRAPLGPTLAAAAAANLCLGAAYALAGAGASPPWAIAAALGIPAIASLVAWLWLRRRPA